MINEQQLSRRRVRLLAWLLAPVLGAVTALGFVSPAQAALLPCEITYRATYTSNDPTKPGQVNGFTTDVQISNTGTQPFARWYAMITLDDGVTIVQAWNSYAYLDMAPRYQFAPATWNPVVAAGQSTRFGFRATIPDPSVPVWPTRMSCYGFTE